MNPFFVTRPIHFAALIFSSLLLPDLASAKVAEIVALTGQGEHKPASSSDWREAKIQQSLDDKDFVRTGKKSVMGLLFAGQTQLRLDEEATMQVLAPAAQGATTATRRFVPS